MDVPRATVSDGKDVLQIVHVVNVMHVVLNYVCS